MATLTALPPLTGGGDMNIDLSVGVLDSLSSAKGVVKLSVDPVDPLNPIAWGKNDGNVEVTANKVTVFGTPTDAQYPSALLVATQLALKANKVAIVPGTGTKLTWNEEGLIVAGVAATTADIGEVADKRYVTDGQHEALLALSGINTGDQDLSAYALQSALDTTNATIADLTTSLSSYALVTNLDATNATVAAITADLVNYALVTDLALTNAAVDAITQDIVTNYTPLTTHNALQANFDALTASLSEPATVPSTAFEAKLTFESGLTRVGDTITNDAMTNLVGPHLFLGNQSSSEGVPTFVQPAAEDLVNETTGSGKVVLDTFPVISGPTMLAPVVAMLEDDGVSTSPSILVIDHEFIGGGSIVPGFGTTLEFRARSSNVANRTQGAIRTVWTNATDGSRTTNMVLSPVLNGIAVDTLWIHGDGSMALGANVGYGLGLFHAHGGFSTDGVGELGNVLVDNGVKFVAGKLDARYLVGQFASCTTNKITTVDQTLTTETSHFSVPVLAGSTAGTIWRIIAWGNMDHGTSSVTFVCYLRWAGITGPVLAQSHNITTPGSTETNRPWKAEFLVIVTSVGALGSARTSCTLGESMTNAPNSYLGIVNSGGTDVSGVNTTINTTMEMTWTISGTTGAPHVRTFGAFAELVSKPTSSVT